MTISIFTPAQQAANNRRQRKAIIANVEQLESALSALKADMRWAPNTLPDWESPQMREALLAAYKVFEIDELHDAAMAIPDEEAEACDPFNPYGLTAGERGLVL